MGASLEGFRDRYWKDRDAGAVRPLEEYLESFPGEARAIAREYLVNEEGTLAPGEAPGPREDGEEALRVGPYVTERELGRGGQGIVYLARDTRLDRRVALKVLTRLGPGSGQVLERFQREAEVASRLEHPGICGIIDTAMEGNVPWIAMRFVEGRSLAQMIADSRPEGPETLGDHSIISFDDDEEPAPEPAGRDPGPGPKPPPLADDRAEVMRVVRVFESAARALHAAHEVGIVHRDIKPGNIILGPGDQPVILDFGLAHDDVGDGPSLTQSGDLFGTPAYMSPEQLMAQRIDLDRRSDVWSLGVTLYECLTLTRPFEAPTRQALYQTIMTKEPPDPRAVNRSIPPDLRVVLQTALEKDRDRRYATALELAEELRRVRSYEPIAARPAGPLLRLRRWSQRNPAVAALVFALILLLPLVSFLLARSAGESERAQLAAGKAEAETRLREKVEAEAALLQQDARDRAFRSRIDDLGARMGLLLFLFPGKAAHGKQIQGYLEAFERFGLPLDGSRTAADLAERIRALRARDERLARTTMGVLTDFDWLLREAGLLEPGEPDHAGFRRVLALAKRVVEGAEWDDWYRRALVASSAFDAGNRSALDPFYVGPAAEGLAAHPLYWIGVQLFVSDHDKQTGIRLVDRSIELAPDVFETRFVRGGMEMDQYQRLRMQRPETPEVRARRDAVITRAIHQFEVALALRPESGISWAMLGMARGAGGRYQGALEAMNRSTEESPESPLCWCLRGFMYGMSRRWDQAEAALVRALDLDPTFEAARDALERVRKRQPPELRPRSMSSPSRRGG